MTIHRRCRRIAVLLPGIAACMLAAGCGSTTAGNADQGSAATPPSQTASPRIAAPARIASAGKISYCSTISYPPLEFYQGPTPVGADIDIGTQIARLMGVDAEFQNLGFDGIIASLLANKCDAILAGMTVTPEREKQIDFVRYLRTGMSLMVQKGNPQHIAGLADLSGKSVGVEIGATERNTLVAENQKLIAQGKPPIKIVTFQKDSDAAQALATNKVDAYFADSAPVAYYISKASTQFEFAGPPINSAAAGIGLRKNDDAFERAVRTAVNQMYTDGTMMQILKKWNMSDFAARP
jgi:polar amino acid transport system substrate-binding protein